MIDSTSCVALELVRAAPDATIVLEQASTSLPYPVRDLRESQITTDRRKPGLAASRRLEHLVLRSEATDPVESTIDFRDLLRRDATARAAYQEEKLRLAGELDDVHAYTEAKTPIIRRLQDASILPP